jgi:hypothetical protein
MTYVSEAKTVSRTIRTLTAPQRPATTPSWSPIQGGIDAMPWADNDNVTAITSAHFPGQEIDSGVADVLYGAANPSGHLPNTIAYNTSAYNTVITNFIGTNDTNGWQSNFTEYLLINYRYFDYANITLHYEFGFDLSYTTFSLSSLLSCLSPQIAPLFPPRS